MQYRAGENGVQYKAGEKNGRRREGKDKSWSERENKGEKIVERVEESME